MRKIPAYTLIELLISITLFSLLGLLSLPIAISQLQGADAETTAKVLVNDAYEYQQSAYTKKDSVKPTNLVYQTNFDNYTVGALPGQNGWVAASGSSNWTVQASTNGNLINQNTFFANPMLSVINQSLVSLQNVTVSVDFQVDITSGSGNPELWVRRPGLDSTNSGYMFLYYGNQFYFNYYPGGVNLASTNVTDSNFLTGSWYTSEFEIHNDASGNPVLNGFMYPQGGTRPSTPTLTYTDTNKRLPGSGYTGLGTYSNSMYYDNYKIYSGVNSTKSACFGINFQNLGTQRQYTLFSGDWSDTLGCLNRNNTSKKLSGGASATTSATEIIFSPGNIRPIPSQSAGSATSTSSSNTITATTTFSPVINVGDNISFANNQSAMARVLSVTSNTSIITDTNLINQTSQALKKSVDTTITVTNNSNSFQITITNEGQISYKRIS